MDNTKWFLPKHISNIMIVFGMNIIFCVVILCWSAVAYGSNPVYIDSSTGESSTVSSTLAKVVVLEAEDDSVTCGKVEYKGKVVKQSETLTLIPTYAECTGNIGGTVSSASITPGSCEYELSTFQEGSEKEGEISELTGDESIAPSTCGAIKIEIPASSCTFEVQAQGPVAGAKLSPDQEELKEEEPLEVRALFSNASAKHTKGCEKAPCPKIGAGVLLGAIGAVAGPLAHAAVKGIYASFKNAKLSYFVGGVKITNVEVGEGLTEQIEVSNKSGWPIFVWSKDMEGNPNWKYENVPGEIGEYCGNVGIIARYYGKFFSKKCKFKVKAPNEKPAIAHYRFEDLAYPRGEVELKAK